MSRPGPGVYAVPVFALGAASGLASVTVHDRSWLWFLLAVSAPVAITVAVASLLLRFAFVAGWFAVLMLAVLGRPEGDYAVGGGVRGYSLLVFGLLLLAAPVATIRRPVRAAP